MNFELRSLLKAGSLSFALIGSIGLSLAANAQWSINNDQSTLSFVTVKAEHVAEVHTFDRLGGDVGEDGSVEINIDLSSVNTLIPIRNERMQAMLFEVGMYPRASITADVDYDHLASLAVGSSETMDLAFDLSLHGQTRSMTSTVRVTRLENGLTVSTVKPIVVTADQFNLVEGVEALREVAGLPSISRAVPVSFQLFLN